MSPLTEPTKLVLKSYGTPAAIAGVAPTLDYRFALDRRELDAVSLTDKLTVTRAATAAVNGPTGYLELAGPNVARFDHNLTTHQSLGLLVEESSTNLTINSEDFASWGVFGTLVTSNNAVAPDGTSSADKLTFQNTSYSSRFNTIATTAATVYTLSVFAKAGSTDKLGLEFRGAGTLPDVLFTLSGQGSTSDSNISTIKYVRDGWYRCELTETSIDTSEIIIIGRGASGSVGDTLYLWGAQLETGSTATTYIPTTGSTVTRTESAIIDGTGVITGTYTMVEKPAGCAVVNGTNIDLQTGYTAERVMVFPAALSGAQITAIRSAM